MLFAHLKRVLKLDRLRLRCHSGAHDEFTLAAAAQNLRKLAKLVVPPTTLAPRGPRERQHNPHVQGAPTRPAEHPRDSQKTTSGFKATSSSQIGDEEPKSPATGNGRCRALIRPKLEARARPTDNDRSGATLPFFFAAGTTGVDPFQP